MKHLLDAHTFCWRQAGDNALLLKARATIADKDNEPFVSAITAWELVTKYRSGKQHGFAEITAEMAGAVAAQRFTELTITLRHAEVSATLPPHHKDLMDRFIIAQALAEDMTIVTIASVFSQYAVETLW